MSHIHCQGGALHLGMLCIRPLVSLRAFAPCSNLHRDSGGLRAQRHQANMAGSWCLAAKAGGNNVNPELVRDIARMMPDPAGSDDLLAPDQPYGMGTAEGWGYGGGPGGRGPDARMQDAYNDLLNSNDLLNTDSYSRDSGDMYMDSDTLEAHLAQLPPELRQQELQRLGDQEARMEWEIEQAQENAMKLHHDQMANASSRYDMALRLGDIMEELSQHDYYTHDGQDAVPAWVRAHFILEQQMVQQRAGEGSVPQTAAAKQQLGSSSLERPLDDILPGAETQQTIEAFLDDLIGAKPPEQATYAAAAYDDEDAGDAIDADENDFETSTASEEPEFPGLSDSDLSETQAALLEAFSEDDEPEVEPPLP